MGVLWLAGMGACNSSLIDARYDEQVSINETTLGEADALRVAILPGRFLPSSQEDTILSFWTSGPMPVLELDNGQDEAAALDITLHNVTSLRGSYVVEALPDDAHALSGCDAQPPVVSVTTPAPARATEVDSAQRLVVEVAPCSRVRFVPALTASQSDTYTIAVVGPLTGNPAQREALVRAISERELDYVHFLGAGNADAQGSAYLDLLDLACPDYPTCRDDGLRAPFGVSFGENDVQSWQQFHTWFGQTDYVSRVGDVNVMALNTSLAALSDAQFGFVAAQPTDAPAGLVFLDHPPFSLNPLLRHGFRNQQEASRLQSMLEARGYRWVFAVNRDSDDLAAYEVGETTVYAVPPGGFAEVSLRRARSDQRRCDDATPCDAARTCVAGQCMTPCEVGCSPDEVCDTSGMCRQACTDATACSGPAPLCFTTAGYCATYPAIEVSWHTADDI